ncbi:hypothetical protein [Candidatus Cardinium hertigii]|jgi:hypothetical protein|uniref:Uncharacterized protein n=1 Tax=Candidatus Cardinium hertigii TaxID=247481 RepID=A0A3N2QCB8_9BACT|nr:hypothetical protein [Candidatus Cardinium hertigii]ROT47100.1 hypothetical protein EDM02_04405 [Candidatus Cardinium hertigii]ROT47425.1 hypothetical protein EDM02_03270 [Candidatus Cardinium hertigii]
MENFNRSISWIDVPHLNTIEAHFHSSINQQLCNILKKYEELHIENQKNLQSKIQLLNEIINKLQELYISRSVDASLYKYLYEISIKRKNYILALCDPIYNINKPIEEQFTEYFTSIEGNISKGYNPLFLNNDTFFDFKKKAPWGRYWIEAIDPCHRDLTIWYNKWLGIRIHQSLPPFFFWLETQPLTHNEAVAIDN